MVDHAVVEFRRAAVGGHTEVDAGEAAVVEGVVRDHCG